MRFGRLAVAPDCQIRVCDRLTRFCDRQIETDNAVGQVARFALAPDWPSMFPDECQNKACARLLSWPDLGVCQICQISRLLERVIIWRQIWFRQITSDYVSRQIDRFSSADYRQI